MSAIIREYIIWTKQVCVYVYIHKCIHACTHIRVIRVEIEHINLKHCEEECMGKYGGKNVDKIIIINKLLNYIYIYIYIVQQLDKSYIFQEF